MRTRGTSQDRLPVSFVLATHNRCAELLNTLHKFSAIELPRDEFEVIVVDNASTDGSADAAKSLADIVLRRTSNQGSCAKAWGTDIARGRFVVFLDDDSFPRFGSIKRMLLHFENDPQLASAGFTVHLPDGRRECSALPGVSVGCGVGYRAEALRAVGGLDRTFFMQAEEYDLAFKLVSAGWNVRIFNDLHVDHLKTASARQSERTTFYDVRNNLRVIARHLPAFATATYRSDWLQRYAWLAERDDRLVAYRRGRRSGHFRAALDRFAGLGKRLPPIGFEYFFRWNEVESRFRQLHTEGCRRLVGIDFGKNIFAFRRAAALSGIELVAICDDRFAAPLRTYRGIPIVPFELGMKTPCDAFVVCNMAAEQADASARRTQAMTDLPVHRWFGTATTQTVRVDSVAPQNPNAREHATAAEVLAAVVR